MRSVELFSGCGGLALGAARAGFDHELMVEWNKEACGTLGLNSRKGLEHAREWMVRSGDVRDVRWADVVGAGVDLVAGGPPCQPFSVGGKHRGHRDVRDMWPEAIRAVRELRPRAFLFENVRGLTRTAFADYLSWIRLALAHPGLAREESEDYHEHLKGLKTSRADPEYDVLVVRVNAADYGAAQKRHRVVIVGIRRELDVTLVAPAPTHSRERLLWDQWITGEYWRGHGVDAPAGPASDADRRLVGRLLRRGEPPPGEPWRTVRDALAGLGEPDGRNGHVFQDGARVYPGHTGSPIDGPAKALKAGDHGVPGGENMMVRDDGSVRYFTIREAARLQGLPDEWEFPSSWTESMRQLGNAVPTQLAEAMTRWIAETLPNESADQGIAA